MRITAALSLAAALLAAPAAVAQIRVEIGLPSIRFEVAPPLVVVAPGVQVVENYGEEVFFVDGHYWCRRDNRWFRARDYRGGWVVVERHRVPGWLVKAPPGHYKHYKVKAAKVKPGRGGDVLKVREIKVDRKHPGRGHGNGKKGRH